jgi:DNA-binding LacI/PurR family transcriptional regulator
VAVAGTRVTLADIAARVGVSSKTVSNVVNGTGWVGAEVRARVEAAIEELGYRPNLAARHLRRGSSGILALALPTLAEPYFAELAAAFVDAAQARGLTVLVAQTGGRREVEVDMLEGIRLPALDGLILSPLQLTREDLDARRSRSALVLLGEHGEALAGDDVHHVGVDNVAAAAAATRALLARGRRRIATIGIQEGESQDTSRLRFAGYVQALAEAGLPVVDELLGSVSDFNRAEGSLAAERLLDAGAEFDALLCFNDSLALGALYTLGVRGVRVPDDVEVMGFDDIAEGRFSIPSFSTVDPGRAGVAERVLDILAGTGAGTGEGPGAAEARGHHEVPYAVILR